MHDFVMRKGLHKRLGPLVDHAEGQLIMVEFSEQWILLKVVEAVMHPAHIPLIVEAEATFGHGLRHAWIGRRLLGDGDHAGMVEMHQCVDLAQEFDGLEVFATAMPIGHPFAGLARIIQVKHRRHGIDAEAIDVKTF